MKTQVVPHYAEGDLVRVDAPRAPATFRRGTIASVRNVHVQDSGSVWYQLWANRDYHSFREEHLTLVRAAAAEVAPPAAPIADTGPAPEEDEMKENGEWKQWIPLKASVKLRADGQLQLNEDAAMLVGEHCLLFWNQTRRAIALLPAGAEDEGALSVKRGGRGGNMPLLGLRDFLNDQGIEPRTVSHNDPLKREDDKFVVQLTVAE